MMTLLPLSGCASESEADDASVDVDEEAAEATTHNGLSSAALRDNLITSLGLEKVTLSSKAILADPCLKSALMIEPESRQVLLYIVNCALEPGKHVSFKADGRDFSFVGRLGVAPQWGMPGQTCKAD